MEKRVLGRTGHESTVVTFGAAGLGRVTQEAADTAIEQFIEAGVNHIDIAPSYGEAMERMAPWMRKIRDDMFLGSKTRFRTKSEAWDDIQDIFQRLKIDSFDLFQLHSVISMEDLDQVTATNDVPRSCDPPALGPDRPHEGAALPAYVARRC